MTSNKLFLASAEHIATPLDCRILGLVIYFYQMDQHSTVHLCQEIFRQAVELGNDSFIYSWNYGLKNTSEKNLWSQMQQCIDPISGMHVSFDACVKSSAVYNLTSRRRYLRDRLKVHPVYSFGWEYDPGWSSIDYLPFNRKIFPGRLQPEEIISKLHALFREENRKCLSMHGPFDYCGSFTATPYTHSPGLFYGKVTLSFGAFCLGESINSFAEIFSSFAKQIAKKYVNVNAHVRLQPYTTFESHYTKYFGRHAITDGSHTDANCSPKEWYSTYYLNSVEWLNILSPVSRQHLESNTRNIFLDDSFILEIPGGCLAVGSVKHITQYEWVDAVRLKRILSNALYCSSNRIALRYIFPDPTFQNTDLCPRNDWAIVPIEDGEIEISGNELCYFRKP